MPRDKDDPLAKQNIKDRYAGHDDPVAAKMLARVNAAPALRPPADKDIKTLWIGGLEESIGSEDLKAVFYAYGEVVNVRVVPRNKCAFVEFATHDQAKVAAENTHASLEIKGVKLKVNWASKANASTVPAGGAGGGGGAFIAAGASGAVGRAEFGAAVGTGLLGADAVPLSGAAGALGFPVGAGVAHGGAGGGAVHEAYPGQSLGLAPPVGFAPMPFAPSAVTSGPLRTDTRGPRSHPYYPSMNPHAVGSRLSST